MVRLFHRVVIARVLVWFNLYLLHQLHQLARDGWCERHRHLPRMHAATGLLCTCRGFRGDVDSSRFIHRGANDLSDPDDVALGGPRGVVLLAPCRGRGRFPRNSSPPPFGMYSS